MHMRGILLIGNIIDNGQNWANSDTENDWQCADFTGIEMIQRRYAI